MDAAVSRTPARRFPASGWARVAALVLIAIAFAATSTTKGAPAAPRASLTAVVTTNAGVVVALRGRGFPAGAAGNIAWTARWSEGAGHAGGGRRWLIADGVRISADGSLTASVRLPYLPAGSLQFAVMVKGVHAKAAVDLRGVSGALTRQPAGGLIVVSPAVGVAGDSFVVSGQGFPAGRQARLAWAGVTKGMPAFTTTPAGRFRTRVEVPPAAAATVPVGVTLDGMAVTAPFTVGLPRLDPATPRDTPAERPESTRRVVAYFPIWNANSGYTADDVDFDGVTHIAHFSVVPRADGSIEVPDWGPFPDPTLVDAAHAHGVRALLVVGGDHDASRAAFSAMSASAAARKRFAAELLELVGEHDYDGVDLDWEYPAGEADRDNLTRLIRELRAALPSRLSLSLSGPGSDWYGRWFDVEALAPHIDWLASMTYTFAAASWSSSAGHNSALYGPASLDSARSYFLGRGLPSAKLLLGIAFYGERFDGAAELGQPLASDAGESVPYPDVVALIENGWTRHRDNAAGQMPYLLRDHGAGVIVYDDAVSIAAKCSYVRHHDVAGVIVWRLGQDVTTGGQPLMRAVKGCR